jgi:murein DD-endopeptidase MepM/ murein hydrolase activator NlpD
VQSAEAPTAAADDPDEEDDGSGVRLYQSIYESALRSQIPRPVIADLIRVYSYDVDFQRKTEPGDSFEVLYVGEDENPDSKADVLYASLTIGGEPILGYTKMHTGVDWAAPMGTPIFASGTGVVEKAGWEGGYGKYIRIKHNNGYETAYGHMTAFARGMQPGTRVRQGQVIGFIGSTGLSTGAHVHYEILVNGRFVDPMRIKLPRGRALEGAVLANFDKERERIDSIMVQRPGTSAPRIASSGR